MSNAVLEAMACKCPCIVSNIPENEELIKNNYNGLTFQVKDLNDLANKIIELYNSKEKRLKFAKKSRQIVEEKYDIKKIIQQLDDFLYKF